MIIYSNRKCTTNEYPMSSLPQEGGHVLVNHDARRPESQAALAPGVRRKTGADKLTNNTTVSPNSSATTITTTVAIVTTKYF